MSRRLLVATLMVDAAILTFVFGFDRPRVIYSMSVSEFVARGLWERRVRVQGTVVHATLCRIRSKCGFRFRMADRPRLDASGSTTPHALEELSVSYDGCELPDLFRDVPGIDLEVAVEGERCRSCHEFEAANVIAKYRPKYERADYRAAYPAASFAVARCSSLASSRG